MFRILAALRTPQPDETETLRAALEEIADKWVSNNSEDDDYEEGYDDGLKACHDIAAAAALKGTDHGRG